VDIGRRRIAEVKTAASASDFRAGRLDESIARLSVEIEQRVAAFSAQRDLLLTIPGVQQRNAEVLIAEIGVDMTAFPTPKHLASWAGMCPGNDQSAGKRRSGKTRRGSKWLRASLTEAAIASTRKKDSYLSPRNTTDCAADEVAPSR
jgi:transposase